MISPFIIRRIRGQSMEPTLRHGQIVIALGRNKPKIDQIVIALHEGKEKIKRINEIDGAHVFLLGDNLDKSTDSRDFGLVLANSIIGTVVWPLKRKIKKID